MTEAKKRKKQANIEQAESDAAELEDAGHTVTRFTDFHWRVDDKIDVWPSTKKFMKRDGSWVVRNYTKIIDIFNGTTK